MEKKTDRPPKPQGFGVRGEAGGEQFAARDLKKELAAGQAVKLVGIIDYDPSGALIAESFRHQLELSGLEIAELS